MLTVFKAMLGVIAFIFFLVILILLLTWGFLYRTYRKIRVNSKRESERKALADYISSNNLKVVRLLNTHLHLDHVLGNAFVERTYGVKPEAHEEDAFLLELQEEQSRMFGLPIEETSPALGDYLAEGDVVEIPGISLKVSSSGWFALCTP